MMRDNDTHDDESRFDRYDGFVEGRHLLDYVKVLAGFKGSSQHVLAGVRVAVR